MRNQTGTLAKAFAKHEKDPRVNAEEVKAWKAALKAMGNISGWHVNDRYHLSSAEYFFSHYFQYCHFFAIEL